MGNTTAAINKLTGFINQVEAQRGKKLSDAEADLLHDAAQSIIDAINAGALPKQTGDFSPQLASVPDSYQLEQNYPNPFNPSTTITFGVPEASEVTLAIYNMRGQLIQTLHSGPIAAGQHNVVWNGNDSRGVKVASGVYVYRLESKGFVLSKKLAFMK